MRLLMSGRVQGVGFRYTAKGVAQRFAVTGFVRNLSDGRVELVVEGDAAEVTDDATLRRLAQAWRTKWDGRWRFRARDGSFHHEAGAALVFAVVPAKVLAFGKGGFSQTRHSFRGTSGG